MTLSKQITSALLAITAGSGIGLATAAMAQPPAPAATSGSGQLAAPKTGRENLVRLQKAITVDMKEWRLADVISHLTTETGAVLEPVWKSTNEDGLDPDMLVSFSGKGLDGLTVLERVLEKASGEAITSDEKATWQMTSYGAVQIGPRKALNRSRRTEVYDVSDLLFEVPVYDDVPVIDLAQVLQSSSGGKSGHGGGTSIFEGGKGSGDQKRQADRTKHRAELADGLKHLIASLAEKDQWEENGGSGGTMTVYQGNIIIDAPDYMHRAVAGYSWLPAARPAATSARRYVSLSGDVEAAKVIGLTPFAENGGAPGNAPGGAR